MCDPEDLKLDREFTNQQECAEEAKQLSSAGLHLELTRRGFIQSSALLSFGAVAGGVALAADPNPGDATHSFTLQVNGKSQALQLDPRTSLLDALREHLNLTGSKKGCDHGQCGACTVLIDNRRVNSCLTLAVAAEGCEITTVEGLAKTADPQSKQDLHPMQASFLEHDGYQCGYCTPGQICSAIAAVDEFKRGQLSVVSFETGQAAHPDLTDAELRERMSGNICRCGAYSNIIAAVRAQAEGVIS